MAAVIHCRDKHNVTPSTRGYRRCNYSDMTWHLGHVTRNDATLAEGVPAKDNCSCFWSHISIMGGLSHRLLWRHNYPHLYALFSFRVHSGRVVSRLHTCLLLEHVECLNWLHVIRIRSIISVFNNTQRKTHSMTSQSSNFIQIFGSEIWI